MYFIPDKQLYHRVCKYVKLVDRSQVIVDTREKRSKVVKFLQEQGIALRFQSLPEGDYFFPTEQILIERKQINDLHKSFASGRLFDQVDRLVRCGHKVVLLLEGELGYGNIHPNTILGAQLELSLKMHIPIMRTKNYLETVNMLLIILARIVKGGYDIPAQVYQQDTTLKYEKNLQLRPFLALPGCGPTIGQKLLEKYGSFKNFVMSDPKKWERVQGLGHMTVGKWKEMLGVG